MNDGRGEELQYLAAELTRHVTLYDSYYREYKRRVVWTRGRPIEEPLHHIVQRQAELRSIRQGLVTGALDAEAIENALTSRMPAREAEIRRLARRVPDVYGRLLLWGLQIRDANVEPVWKPFFVELSVFADRPVHQLREYFLDLTASIRHHGDEVSAGRKSRLNIPPLKLLGDPNEIVRFNGKVSAFIEANQLRPSRQSANQRRQGYGAGSSWAFGVS